MAKPRLIAFYLPQFYPTKENDEWWYKGFTEWANVGKAKPLFRGHNQPRVPADLGYYDLRVPEVREKQAQLAREAGIEGFCYWHYWFAGRRLLDRVFREVVESGEPDFPFCLCWANHSWYQKTWNSSKTNRLIIEQTYPGEQDYIDHFYAMLPAFKDKRYMKVDGRPIFGVFDSFSFVDFPILKKIWNKLAKENGLKDFYFFGFTFRTECGDEILSKGYDAIVPDYIMGFRKEKTSIFRKISKRLFHRPNVMHYDDYSNYVLSHYMLMNNIHPCINPNFDHSPRSKEHGIIICDHSPERWKKLCKKVFSLCSTREGDCNMVFIKAWNEWGEGNYLEPDLKFGRKFIDATRESIDSVE